MESKSRPLATTFAALGLALAIMFILVWFFKAKMMVPEERFKRECIQGASLAVMNNNAASPEDLASGPAPRPRLFKTFPWYSIEAKPDNKLLLKVYNFCDSVFLQQQHNQVLYNAMYGKAAGTHTEGAARILVDHIDSGWGSGQDTQNQRKILIAAINDWRTLGGPDSEAQDVLAKYDHIINDPAFSANMSRIVTDGRFDGSRDICGHADAFNKFNIAKDPAAFLKALACK